MCISLVAVVGLDRKFHSNSALCKRPTRSGDTESENECRSARLPRGARVGLGGPWIGSHFATPPNASLHFLLQLVVWFEPPARRVFVVIYILRCLGFPGCVHKWVSVMLAGNSETILRNLGRHTRPYHQSARKKSKAELDKILTDRYLVIARSPAPPGYCMIG